MSGRGVRDVRGYPQDLAREPRRTHRGRDAAYVDNRPPRRNRADVVVVVDADPPRRPRRRRSSRGQEPRPIPDAPDRLTFSRRATQRKVVA